MRIVYTDWICQLSPRELSQHRLKKWEAMLQHWAKTHVGREAGRAKIQAFWEVWARQKQKLLEHYSRGENKEEGHFLFAALV